MDDELKNKLKYLRLPGLLAHWDEWLEMARRGNYSQARLLKHVVDQEHLIKQANSRTARLNRAKIPEPFVMETFPFDRQPKLNRKKILSIYDAFDYMTNHNNVMWIGPTGTGKTGMATAFLTQAIERGYTGRFVGFPELVETLYRSVADHSEAKVLRTFASYDVLLIDEVGYVEVEPVQVGLFFTLMQRRQKTKTSLITSNRGFDQWTSFLKNDQLTAALIDRLTENGYVINMRQCVSLRAKLKSI